VVHVAAEYVPFARTGGLAEAAANLAQFQSRMGIRSLAIVPLYRSAREQAGELEPVGEAFEVHLGSRRETVRILRQRDPLPFTTVYFVEHDGFFDRPKLYGDQRGDYSDNHLRFALFAQASVMELPAVNRGTVLLHAHDWHAALALAYLRTSFGSDPRYRRVGAVLSVHNAGYQGHYPAEAMADLGLPWELFNWRQLEWYGKLNLLKAGLVFADHVVTVSPNHAVELRTPEGGFGLQEVFAGLGSRFSGILNGIDVDVWDPARDPGIAAPFSDRDFSGKTACKLALQERFRLRKVCSVSLLDFAERMLFLTALALGVTEGGLLGHEAHVV
jgi:starch synthase